MGLKLVNVSKKYGNKVALDKLSFEMNNPRCFWASWNKWCWQNDNY